MAIPSLIPVICDFALPKNKLQMKLKLLINWPWDEKVILDYPGGADIISTSLPIEEVAESWVGELRHWGEVRVMGGGEDTPALAAIGSGMGSRVGAPGCDGL